MTAALACACVAGCAAEGRAPGGGSEQAGERTAGVTPKREAAAAGSAKNDASGPVAPPRRPAPRVVVTRHDPGLPTGCRPRPLAQRIAGFFDAFNRGDPSAAEFVAPARGWYSVSDGRRRHFVTSSRRGLRDYFARRHRHGERLRLLEVDVSFARGLGHIAYRIMRRADDLRRLGIIGTTAVGKGALDCETGEIVVWSMGMPAGERFPAFALCPRPRVRTGAIVACARRGG